MVQHQLASWAGKVRPLALKPEPGRNYTFEETVQFNNENKMVTGFWGPYEIQPSLWEAAVEQRAKLESGAVRYQANDQGAKDGTVSNCIHSISIMVRPPGQPVPVVYVAPINWGESGSFWVTLALRPWFINPCCKHDELLQFLGPDIENMKRHELDRNPTLDPVIRATQALFQRKLHPNRVLCNQGRGTDYAAIAYGIYFPRNLCPELNGRPKAVGQAAIEADFFWVPP